MSFNLVAVPSEQDPCDASSGAPSYLLIQRVFLLKLLSQLSDLFYYKTYFTFSGVFFKCLLWEIKPDDPDDPFIQI